MMVVSLLQCKLWYRQTLAVTSLISFLVIVNNLHFCQTVMVGFWKRSARGPLWKRLLCTGVVESWGKSCRGDAFFNPRLETRSFLWEQQPARKTIASLFSYSLQLCLWEFHNKPALDSCCQLVKSPRSLKITVVLQGVRKIPLTFKSGH